MNGIIYLNISGLFYITLVFIVFFFKKRTNNIEQKIYSALLIDSMLELVIGLITTLLVYYSNSSILITIFSKLYFVSIFLWIAIFSQYLYNLVKNKISKRLNMLLILFSIGIVALPLKTELSKLGINATGPSLYCLYFGTFLFDILCLVFGFKTLFVSKNSNKKLIPLWIFLVLGSVASVIQVLNPELFLLVPLEVFITSVMYNTIENPDAKMLNQMELAKNEAEKASRAKSDFLSSMSHEIRTPLNAIVGLSEDNLNYKDNMPPEVLENSQDIMNASQTLLEIVGSILDINKIETNQMEIVETNYNFKEEITNMCKITEARIGEKNIKFNLFISDKMPEELIGDKTKIKEIVNNILTNAIKYTEEGSIDLNITCDNNYKNNTSNIIITCKDTGKGIKEEDINKLFNKFERLDVEKNSTTEGTGLGLAITKSIVEMMNGKIEVHSEYGKGSAFVVEIPQKINTNVNSALDNEAIENTVINYKGKKVLIVDDNKLNIKVASKVLLELGIEIDECYDGKECVNLVASHNDYDLILMDIMMPGMGGEEALEKLKEIDGFITPVIALTADAVSGAKEKYIEEGFADYLQKPFTKDALKDKLDKIFKIEDNTEDRWKDVPIYTFGPPMKPLDEVVEEEQQKENDKCKIFEENDIDYKVGVEYFGNLELYDEMLSDWYNEVDEKWERILSNKDNMKDYSVDVHSLKSDSKYFGFTKLAELSYDHELKSKEGNKDYIKEHFNELETEYKRVIEVVKKYLESK